MEYNMSNENRSNIQPWKSKLEDLKALPDHRLDKEAAWDKLYAKINDKPPAKKIGWYWIAAACLVFALIVSIFFINNSGQEFTASGTKTKSPGINNKVVRSIHQKDNPKKAGEIVASKNEITVVKKTNSKIIKTPGSKRFIQLRVPGAVSQEEIVFKTSDNYIHPVNVSPSLQAPKPEKKKLRVVHLNELGEPPEEMAGVEHNVSTHYFQIKFANQEVYTSPPVSNSKGITILKLITPVN